MPVNDFEKQVQHKMNALRLQPATQVWEEVERRIQKEKKRRRFIILFFLCGVLLLGGTGWVLTGKNKLQQPADNSIAEKASGPNINSNNKNSVQNLKENNLVNSNIETANQIKKEKTGILAVQSAVIAKPVKERNEKKPFTVVEKRKLKKTTLYDASAPGLATSLNRYEKSVISSTTINEKKTTEKQQNISNDSSVAKYLIAGKTDSASTSIDKTVLIDNEVDYTPEISTGVADSMQQNEKLPASEKNIVISKKRKWEWGITGMAGFAAKAKGISFDESKSDRSSSPNNSTGGGSPGTNIISPSQQRKGFAWQAGVYGKIKITARTWFSVGFNFSSYTTLQRTGVLADTAAVFSNSFYSSFINQFYRPGSQSAYKNHFYFLQLPLTFHWQVNKGIRIPVIFQTGLSPGILTGSNALAYNAGSNIFYRDNKSFNKMQLTWQAGLYTNFMNRSAHPLSAGILLNYHISNLQKVNTNGGNHLAAYGIQLGWLLKK